MDLTIRGVELDEVTSLYVIVGEDLSDVDDARTIEQAVMPGRQSKYASFAQFKPTKDKVWLFTQRMLNPNDPKVEYSIEKKKPELLVEIDRALLEARPALCIAVLVNCGARGWHSYPRIQGAQISSVDSMTLEVRGPTITIAGSSKSADIPIALPK
jgi:hypothetical protein